MKPYLSTNLPVLLGSEIGTRCFTTSRVERTEIQSQNLFQIPKKHKLQNLNQSNFNYESKFNKINENWD